MKNVYALLFFAGITFSAQTVFAQCGPSITCPGNVTVNNAPGVCGSNVTYSPATATTTCSGTTTIFSEDFQAGVGAWTLNVNTGTNAATPNVWEVNASEGGVTPPGCGVANNGDLTLHVTCTSAFCGSLITGAVYNAAKTSNKRVESPVINTTGFSNLTLAFDFISNGDGLLDNASVVYNDGSGWQTLTASIKSPVCGSGQGQWTAYTATLPASCENNANLKIGFNWTNNNDNVGTDPSIAINNITITAPGAATPTITYDHPSGSFFPTGTTVVTATATDISTNTATCTFNVTVNDVENPTINSCPSNISVPVNNAGCTAIVNWTAPTAADNCSVASFTSNHNSGDVFPIGTTAVTYTALDPSGNSATCSFNVTVLNNFDAGIITSNANCFGSADGSASMTVTGGTSPYTYTWNPTGGNNATASNLAAGTYTCLATDANGCTVTRSVTITQPSAITGSQTVSLCEGQTLTVGTSTYSVTGTYSDVLTSASGCDSTLTTDLTVNPLPVITMDLSSIDTLCTTNASVSLNGMATPAGGTWSGNGVTAGSLDPSIAGTGNDLLTYTFTDGNGCTASSSGIVYMDVCMGTHHSSSTVPFTLYPNPGNGNFVLESATAGTVQVYNTVGELVLSEKIVAGKNELSIEKESNGVYFVKITANDKVSMVRLVKEN
ncbi:MAG TPA: HYR domain-containing protein [Bacteroidia bacterium]|jgi:hypothetical protein|nr:HYR domain-containing protein [Bacteroidia bacterium]